MVITVKLQTIISKIIRFVMSVFTSEVKFNVCCCGYSGSSCTFYVHLRLHNLSKCLIILTAISISSESKPFQVSM